MKDERLYGKFGLDFPDHPKIMPLSDSAFRCLIEATLWSRKHLTNGFITKRLAIAKWSLEVLRELATNDPLKPSLVETEEGWYIHDFAEHQTTKEELEALREVRKMAGQRGGRASAEAKRKQVLKQTGSKSKPETETETETETLSTSVVTYVSGETVEAPAKPTPRKKGTRIKADWMPQQATVDRVKASFPNATSEQIRHQHELFICWATGSASANAVKLDWEATWSGWMRRELIKSPTGTTNGKPHKLRALADLAAEVREMETINGRALEA